MSKSRFLVSLALGLMSSVVMLSAQTPASAPAADGAVNAGEYVTVVKNGEVSVYFTLTGDTIYAAVVAPTGGWVGIGLDSSRMDGATIFLGYVDTSGQSQLAVQKGRFHTHSGSDGVTPIAYGIGQTGNDTTLEVALPRSAFLSASQESLPYVYAYGTTVDITARHAFRGFGALPVE